jgi:inner membrane protein
MDPITHTLTGAALSRAGYHRATPLATATLILAANVPDIDILAGFGGSYASVAHRRGWTHGPIALALLPFAVLGLMLAYDRWVRRRRDPGAPPVNAPALFLLALLGTATHPLLDWMNTYGIRLLMPFRREWYYGDALFIVDPWVWLMLGGAVYLAGAARSGPHRSRWYGGVGWGVLALLASILVLATPLPLAAKVVWVVGLGLIGGMRIFGLRAGRFRPDRSANAVAGGATGGGDREPAAPSPVREQISLAAARGPAAVAGERWRSERRRHAERLARWGLGVAIGYITLMVIASAVAAREVRRELVAAGFEPAQIMVAPQPANPFQSALLATNASAYLRGSYHWLERPRIRLEGIAIPLYPRSAVTDAAAATVAGQRFLTWSRFPTFQVEEVEDGYRVRIGDLRFGGERGGGSLGGLTVQLDRELQVVGE